jgi:hypothetical protein
LREVNEVNEFVQNSKEMWTTEILDFFSIETPHYRLGGQDGNLLT